MTNQTKTNNFNYLIDPTFNKFNRSFVLSFENKDDRTSYSPKVEIKSFNLLIDVKGFFDVSVRNKEETYAANIEMNKNDD